MSGAITLFRVLFCTTRYGNRFRSNPDQRLATHAFSLLARSSPASILPATLAAVSVGYMSIGQTLRKHHVLNILVFGFEQVL